MGSDWETIGADEDDLASTYATSKLDRRRKTVNLVFSDSYVTFEALASPDQRKAFPVVAAEIPGTRRPKMQTFYSSSSIYSDIEDTFGIQGENLSFAFELNPTFANGGGRVEAHIPNNLMGIHSQTSSSASLDRFKYDDAMDSSNLTTRNDEKKDHGICHRALLGTRHLKPLQICRTSFYNNGAILSA